MARGLFANCPDTAKEKGECNKMRRVSYHQPADACFEGLTGSSDKRLSAKAEADGCLGEDQFGFRKGSGTRDAVGALRMMAEISLENNQEV